MSSARNIGREIGTAFAVLAIYLLTILSPLHHARASQVDFERLGYTTTQSSWVLCSQAGDSRDDGGLLVAKCPAAGVAKTDFLPPAPVVLSVERIGVALVAPRPDTTQAFIPAIAAPPGGPRAPPALV